MRNFAILAMLLVTLFLGACSSGNSDAPTDGNAHPADWLVMHSADALARADFANCTGCHGDDLLGLDQAVSCYSCHTYNDTPPFVVHPPSWTDPYINHRGYAAVNGSATCTGCHGNDLRGQAPIPGCFAPDFNGQACHAEGPGAALHPLDGSYLIYLNHGPDATADLAACQSCHGQTGGPGSNPRFNIGIESRGGNGCESCHGVGYAHPPTWPGHIAAGNLENACTLCHGVNLDGVDAIGGSCLECHTVNPALNPSGCVSCHNIPPDNAAPAGAVSPNLSGEHGRPGHSTSISANPAETCDRCHSGAGAGTDAHFDLLRPADVNLPFLPEDTIVPVSNGTNTTCTGSCHFDTFDVPHDNESWYD